MKRTILIVSGVVLCLAVVYVLAGSPDPGKLLRFVKNPDIHPAILLLGFFLLPLFGFPVTVLLVLLGLRFGSAAGLLFMFLIMPLHLVISFAAVRFVFGSWIKKIVGESRLQGLQVPEHRHMEFSLVFMAVPGLSYTMKNYLLALSGVKFRYYFLFGWLAQGIMGAPFVILGKSPSDWSPRLIFGMILIFVVIYVFMKWGRKRLQRMLQTSAKENTDFKER